MKLPGSHLRRFLNFFTPSGGLAPGLPYEEDGIRATCAYLLLENVLGTLSPPWK